jgi:hypothetical protein
MCIITAHSRTKLTPTIPELGEIINTNTATCSVDMVVQYVDEFAGWNESLSSDGIEHLGLLPPCC